MYAAFPTLSVECLIYIIVVNTVAPCASFGDANFLLFYLEILISLSSGSEITETLY